MLHAGITPIRFTATIAGLWFSPKPAQATQELLGSRYTRGAPRLKLGRYLFMTYGGRIVFLARFVAQVRSFGAVLSGASCMPWHRFMVADAAGVVTWSLTCALRRPVSRARDVVP